MKIFISHSSKESNIAKCIKLYLNNGFKGAVNFFLSEEIGIGEKWKDAIKNNLNDCNAGLFVITPEFLKSAWLTAEFTAFWLQGKKAFVIYVGDIDFSNLLSPILDCQSAKLEEVESIKNLVESLSKELSLGRTPIETPYDIVNNIVSACQNEYDKAKNKHKDDLAKEILANKKYVQFRYSAEQILILDDERVRMIIDSISNNNFLRLLAEQIIEYERDCSLTARCIDRLSDGAYGDNSELGYLAMFILKKQPTDIINLNRTLHAINNDTVMLRVFKCFCDIDSELCLDYYFNKYRPDGKRYIEFKNQRERMCEHFLSKNIDISSFV